MELCVTNELRLEVSIYIFGSVHPSCINFPHFFAIAVSHSVAALRFIEPFCSMLQKGFDFLKQKFTTRKICLLGVFISITVILAIFATFRIGNQIKIPLKFISVFMTGAIFGPVSAGLVSAIGDILNAVLVPVGPIMPQITAVEFVYGFIWGACFYKAKENSFFYLRSAICALLQLIISITLMSWILTGVGYFSSFSAAVVIRMPAALITFILHMIVCTLGRKLIFRLKKFITKEKF